MNKGLNIQKEYKDLIDQEYELNKQGAMNINANLERTPLYFRNRLTSKTLMVPKVYDQHTVQRFNEIVSTTYGIFKKVIQEYLEKEDYRKLFPFSKELEELILIPNGYDSLLPVARFDIFYNEETEDFAFCEINTDGTSAMNEDRILNEAYIEHPAHQRMIRKYQLSSFELFDSWVYTFMKLYSTYEKKKEQPNVAIVDFLDQGTLREFQEFARRFQRQGIHCQICDIRQLTYRDGQLYSPEGYEIDAIYRRAVTSDIMKHQEELQPFLQAVKDQNVFLTGSFCTQIIHNKWLFYLLHQQRTQSFLTEEEVKFVENHVPKTVLFAQDSCDRRQVEQDKDTYILKPLDSYASSGVYAGVEFTQEQWLEKVAEVWEQDYICQAYAPQYSTDNIDFPNGEGVWQPYINMAGLYVYNGHFAGVFSRLSDGGIIASHRNERTVPTYILQD